MISGNWNHGAAWAAGAVTWGNRTTGSAGVVSAANSLVGGTAGDKVGYAWPPGIGVAAAGHGNYVVHSSEWYNGETNRAGAA